MKKEKRNLLLGLCALLGAAGLLALLNSRITLYSDDYWYGTFLRNGADAFWQEMKNHYLTTNGRFYIHLIVPVVLTFGTKLFAVLSPLLLALLFWWGHRFMNPSLSLPATLAATALGMLTVMAADPRYLRMTLLWISAYFNYIFPLVLLLGAAYFQQKCAEKRSIPLLIGGLLLALFVGASTEQCGIAALVLLGGQALFQRKNLRSWLYPLAAGMGFLTILLAPGSWARVDRGVAGGILSFLQPEVFFARFFDAMGYVVRYPSTVILLTALFLLGGLLRLTDRRLSKGLWAGFPLAAGQLLWYVLRWEKVACFWAVGGVALLAILFFLQREYRPTGLVMTAGLAAHMMLIITGLNSERTVFCGIVALMLAAVGLLMRLGGRLRLGVAAVTAAVCICCWAGTFAGYCRNYETVQKNLLSIEEMEQNGVVQFDMDLNPRYRYTMPCDGAAFYANYRNYYRIPDSVPMEFTSQKWIVHPLEGSMFPALEREGVVYLPIDHTLHAAGGQAVWSWSERFYTLTLRGNTFHATKEGQLWQVLPDGTRHLLTEDLILFSPHYDLDTLLYGSAAQLEQYLGIH